MKILSRKFKTKPSQKTISNWMNEYKQLCSFHNLRKHMQKIYSPGTIIEKYTLMHNNLPYIFQVHMAKMELLFKNKLYSNEFSKISRFHKPLKKYFEKIPTRDFPHHIFQENKNGEEQSKEKRASQLKFDYLEIKKMKKRNSACRLSGWALNLAKTNKERHQTIQDFMLINDSTTIAAEIPVYLTNWDAGYYRNQRGFIFKLSKDATPITGHIDILQIRNGKIHILDYKPEAGKVDAVNQLTVYALALSRKMNLPLKDFKCAWFDEKNYFEFFPLHAVYKKKRFGMEQKKLEKNRKV